MKQWSKSSTWQRTHYVCILRCNTCSSQMNIIKLSILQDEVRWKLGTTLFEHGLNLIKLSEYPQSIQPHIVHCTLCGQFAGLQSDILFRVIQERPSDRPNWSIADSTNTHIPHNFGYNCSHECPNSEIAIRVIESAQDMKT